MAYKFGGLLYSNSSNLAAGIAAEFFGQHSMREILTAFRESTAEEMACEAIDGWDLDREEWMQNGDITAEMIADALEELRDRNVAEVIHEIEVDDVRVWANCTDVDADADGNVWIAGPQTGHWLNRDERLSLALWAINQQSQRSPASAG